MFVWCEDVDYDMKIYVVSCWEERLGITWVIAHVFYLTKGYGCSGTTYFVPIAIALHIVLCLYKMLSK